MTAPRSFPRTLDKREDLSLSRERDSFSYQSEVQRGRWHQDSTRGTKGLNIADKWRAMADGYPGKVMRHSDVGIQS